MRVATGKKAKDRNARWVLKHLLMRRRAYS